MQNVVKHDFDQSDADFISLHMPAKLAGNDILKSQDLRLTRYFLAKENDVCCPKILILLEHKWVVDAHNLKQSIINCELQNTPGIINNPYFYKISYIDCRES